MKLWNVTRQFRIVQKNIFFLRMEIFVTPCVKSDANQLYGRLKWHLSHSTRRTTYIDEFEYGLQDPPAHGHPREHAGTKIMLACLHCTRYYELNCQIPSTNSQIWHTFSPFVTATNPRSRYYRRDSKQELFIANGTLTVQEGGNNAIIIRGIQKKNRAL